MQKIHDNNVNEIQKLVALIHQLNARGHNTATSGNYSLFFKEMGEYALVSESGIDKAHFSIDNFLPVHLKTKKVSDDAQYTNRKSSDETAIHLAIIQEMNVGCVLHSHFLESLIFARRCPDVSYLTLTGFEMIKAFKGVTTHEEKVIIPVFDNSQDIEALALKIPLALKNSQHCYGLMLRDHGLYVWGKTVSDAKRHLEAFEYLFKLSIALHKS